MGKLVLGFFIFSACSMIVAYIFCHSYRPGSKIGLIVVVVVGGVLLILGDYY